MNESPVRYVAAFWRSRPGTAGSIASAWDVFSAWTMRHQPGVREMRLLRSDDDPPLFIALSTWADAEAIRAWRATPEHRAFTLDIATLCQEVSYHELTLAGERLFWAEARE